MSQPPSDPSIPLLTEIITAAVPFTAQSREPVPAYQLPVQSPAQPAYPSAAVVTGVPVPPVPSLPSAEQLLQLRQEIEENLMQRLLGQVNDVMHQHLQDHLAVVLDNMADMLKSRVRTSLEQALAETVTRALTEEMAKFENAKN